MKSNVSFLDLIWEPSFQVTHVFLCPVKIYKWWERIFEHCFWGHKDFNKWMESINDIYECPTIGNCLRCYKVDVVMGIIFSFLLILHRILMYFLQWEIWSYVVRKWIAFKGKLSIRWEVECAGHWLERPPVIRVEWVSSLGDPLGTCK